MGKEVSKKRLTFHLHIGVVWSQFQMVKTYLHLICTTGMGVGVVWSQFQMVKTYLHLTCTKGMDCSDLLLSGLVPLLEQAGHGEQHQLL